MQDPLTFFIACEPPKSTHQASARIMKRKDGSMFVGKSESSKGAQVKREILTLLSEHRPQDAFIGPVRLKVLWAYSWRKTEPKKNKETGWLMCDKRPDCDNLSKLLKDCMSRLNYWADDSQVAELQFTKAWGETPGIGIHISPMHPMMLPHHLDVFKQHIHGEYGHL
jgi:Holliday junction resolvase RusA-like endonuclease